MQTLTRSGGTLGLILPTLPQGPEPSWDVAGVARAAEEAGADALWACDHLAWHTPVMECFTALTLAATSTSRCALGTGVLQLPLRPAPIVAKTAASVQMASSGRLVLGVGVGLHEGEFEAVEAPFHTRGKRTEEAIDTLRELWGGGVAAGDDRFGGRYRQEPRPATIPIWIGGSGDVARRRCARKGDGWMPLFIPAHEMKDRIAMLREETAAGGRDPGAVVASLVVFVSVGTNSEEARQRGLAWMSSLYRLPGEKFARHLIAGSAGAVAGAITEFFEAGVQHLVVFVTGDEPIAPFTALAQELGRTR